jgi:serine/threonine-protein kinase RsbW
MAPVVERSPSSRSYSARVRPSISLQLAADPPSVGVARDACIAMLGRIGVTRRCIDELVLGVSEACANAVEHATHPGDRYEVRIDVVGEWCHVTVIDNGNGFDTQLAAYDLPVPEQTRGRGLAIMRHVADDLVVHSVIGAGTRVLLLKRLSLEDWSPLAGRESLEGTEALAS